MLLIYLQFSWTGDELITPVYIPPTRPPWKQRPPVGSDYDIDDDEEDDKYNQRLCSGKDGNRNCDFNIGNSNNSEWILCVCMPSCFCLLSSLLSLGSCEKKVRMSQNNLGF